jgi:hypothetical protein
VNNVIVHIHTYSYICTIYIRYHAYTGRGGQNMMVIIIEVVVYSGLCGHTLTTNQHSWPKTKRKNGGKEWRECN